VVRVLISLLFSDFRLISLHSPSVLRALQTKGKTDFVTCPAPGITTITTTHPRSVSPSISTQPNYCDVRTRACTLQTNAQAIKPKTQAGEGARVKRQRTHRHKEHQTTTRASSHVHTPATTTSSPSPFVVRCSLFVVRCSLFVVRRSSFVVGRSSLVVRRSSFVVRRSSFVVRRSSFVVRRSSFVVRRRCCGHSLVLWCEAAALPP